MGARNPRVFSDCWKIPLRCPCVFCFGKANIGKPCHRRSKLRTPDPTPSSPGLWAALRAMVGAKAQQAKVLGAQPDPVFQDSLAFGNVRHGENMEKTMSKNVQNCLLFQADAGCL